MAFTKAPEINVAKEKLSKIQQDAFSSGELIPVSGLWRSNHNDCENSSDLWLRKGDYFPPCLTCSSAASFTLQEEIHHISEDPDFA